MRRRSLLFLVLVLSAGGPQEAQAAHFFFRPFCPRWPRGWHAALSLGFTMPVLTLAALEAVPRTVVYWPGPRALPDPPPPPPPAAPAARDEPVRRRGPASRGAASGEIRGAPGGDPARAEAERMLAAGGCRRAAELYRALQLQRPGEPEIGLRFAEALLGAGSYRYAEVSLRRALSAPPPAGALRARMPAARLTSRRSALEKRLERGEERGRLLSAFAAALSGDAAAARVELKALCERNPRDREAARLLGALPPETGKPEQPRG